MRALAMAGALLLALLLVGCGDDSPTAPREDTPATTEDLGPPPEDRATPPDVPDDPEVTEPVGPILRFTPGHLRFDGIAAGAEQTLAATLSNDGDESAALTHYKFDNPPRPEGVFSVTVAGQSLSGQQQTEQSLQSTISVAPGESVPLTVRCAPEDALSYAGSLQLRGEAPEVAEWLILTFERAVGSPSIEGVPEKVEFGHTWTGQARDLTFELNSTGDAPLRIRSLELRPAGSSFSARLGAPNEVALSLPATVPAGETVILTVSYRPQTASEIDTSGVRPVPIPENVSLVIGHNVPPLNSTPVPLSGFAADPEFPVPIIEVRPGMRVPVGTQIQLDGSGSVAPLERTVDRWEFSVEAPEGACPAPPPLGEDLHCFKPYRAHQSPQYTLRVAGEHHFSLKVWARIDHDMVPGPEVLESQDPPATITVVAEEPEERR